MQAIITTQTDSFDHVSPVEAIVGIVCLDENRPLPLGCHLPIIVFVGQQATSLIARNVFSVNCHLNENEFRALTVKVIPNL
ncbi:hypothetical protein J6590_048306 [Homalodisca vitripennis]|nr:hypothetical protein J6590_048306 [Homalodisca vitripennis]